jgi:hypothetical protein
MQLVSWQSGYRNKELSGYYVVISKDGYLHRRGGETTLNPRFATGYLEKHHAQSAARLLNRKALCDAWEAILIDELAQQGERTRD